ncbi:hypothetical protein [Aureimonas psammosilenae]|uniref:hypothetical protein n=1 Tax=Aureimonas psammosilenae TaxID=2495496 RepID=UPI001260D919|nr:hypothetical protein [Aureimonas psammosilenae]
MTTRRSLFSGLCSMVAFLTLPFRFAREAREAQTRYHQTHVLPDTHPRRLHERLKAYYDSFPAR